VPDPYAATNAVLEVLSPFTDPNYQVRGTPPDGYAIALALRAALAAESKGAVSPSRASMPLTADGLPDPYSPEALRRHQESRR